VSYLTELFRSLFEDTEKNARNLTHSNWQSGRDLHCLLPEH